MRIMCAGDSITAGTGNAGPAYLGGYRRFVMNAFRGVPFVGSVETILGTPSYGQCEGYGGATTATVRTNVLAQIPTYLPTVVCWMTGTNDVTSNIEDSATIFNAASDVLATASVVKVIVSPPPPRKSNDAKYAQTATFRAAMNAYFAAATKPDGMTYYDTGALMVDADFTDTVHPNNTQGYTTLATGWLAALAAAGVTAPDLGYDVIGSGGVWS